MSKYNNYNRQNVFVEEQRDQKISYFNERQRKTRPQAPHNLKPDYICNRCGKPGHYIKDCPTNNDRKYDKKEISGIPVEMTKKVTSENADTAMTTKDGERVTMNITGKLFKTTIRTDNPLPEEYAIPQHLKCIKCGRILQDASMMKCCGKVLCLDCLRDTKREQKCVNCGKDINISKDIIPDLKTRQMVIEYFREYNRALSKENKKQEDTQQVNETKNVEIENQVEVKPQIKELDINMFFNNKPTDLLSHDKFLRRDYNITSNKHFNEKLLGVPDNPNDLFTRNQNTDHTRSRSNSRKRVN